MGPTMTRRLAAWTTVAGMAAASAGCFLFAAGAGAAGAIHFTDRGVESQIGQPIAQVYDASQQAFKDMGITVKRTINEQESGATKRTLEGSTSTRDVSVVLKSNGGSTHVDVVAKKTAVTWDKDFARAIIDRIVTLAK
jgi:hypothetical protein